GRDSRPLHSFPTRRSSDLAHHGEALIAAAERCIKQRSDHLHRDVFERERWSMKKFQAPSTGASLTERRYGLGPLGAPRFIIRRRSEEHTSELQSRENLVCR